MPHSVKSKCRPRFPAGQSAALPLTAVCLLGALLFEQIGFGSALRCYQGQTSVQQPISGSPLDCPMQAYTCIKSVDWSQGLVTRACQSTNCTMPGSYTISYSSVCQNSSGYPPQTFCCCYGDGCNSALGISGSATIWMMCLAGLIGSAMATKLMWNSN